MVRNIKPSQGDKSEQEFKSIRKSGQITARALKKVVTSARPGVTLSELDQIAEKEIISLGGRPAFKTVPGYHWTTCLTVNDEVVHGIPRQIKLETGDILGIDLGTAYQGWYSDAAWSILIGSESPQDPVKADFLKVGQQALEKAIGQARVGSHIGDISAALQETEEGAGYAVVKSLAGHGVGRSYHEDPEIPGFGQKGSGIKLWAGMTLAIEAIYAEGSGKVYQKEDGWTIATEDGGLGGLFEMTVIVGKEKAEVITDWRRV